MRVLFACESGSRAWGFASPDSDYDVRFVYAHPRDWYRSSSRSSNENAEFVYAHPRDWYLSIDDRRDVIERPIVDLYDVNGWDLRKALRLFRRSNPPLLEWLGSPTVYRERTSAAARLRRIAARSFSPRLRVPLPAHGERQLPRLSEGRFRAPQEIPVRPAPPAGRHVDRARSGDRPDRVRSPGRHGGRQPPAPRGNRRPARRSGGPRKSAAVRESKRSARSSKASSPGTNPASRSTPRRRRHWTTWTRCSERCCKKPGPRSPDRDALQPSPARASGAGTVGSRPRLYGCVVGFWSAMRDVCPETTPQRDWCRKMANVLNKAAAGRRRPFAMMALRPFPDPAGRTDTAREGCPRCGSTREPFTGPAGRLPGRATTAAWRSPTPSTTPPSST